MYVLVFTFATCKLYLPNSITIAFRVLGVAIIINRLEKKGRCSWLTNDFCILSEQVEVSVQSAFITVIIFSIQQE